MFTVGSAVDAKSHIRPDEEAVGIGFLCQLSSMPLSLQCAACAALLSLSLRAAVLEVLAPTVAGCVQTGGKTPASGFVCLRAVKGSFFLLIIRKLMQRLNSV